MSAAVTAMPLSTGFSTKKSCDISPTYISSDLLSPSQRGRITTPFIGYVLLKYTCIAGMSGVITIGLLNVRAYPNFRLSILG